MTFGALLLAGEVGVVPRLDGVAGAVESSTNVSTLEHAETLPAVSVAVTVSWVVASRVRVTVRPGEANVPAPPLAAITPVQLEVV